MKVGVLLSGCGVYDGAEIHEAVFTLLALAKQQAEVVCMAPDMEQHHVINHINGEELNEKRNALVEAARIARGQIKAVSEVQAGDIDALALPGGFGAAKNFTKWAFSGPDGEIQPDVKKLIQDMVAAKKPVAAMCMAPVAVAKALEGGSAKAKLTVGTTEAKSPYDIAAISEGMNKTGAQAEMCGVEDIVVDEANKIVTTPCYMMDANITQIQSSIDKACAKLVELAK